MSEKTENIKKVLVVVLGELARSPRMQYHCNSLADNNYRVSVIANRGEPCQELDQNPNIKQSLIDEAPNFRKYLPSILAYILKPIWQSFELIYHLLVISLVHVIIVQNPPSIPTLPILYLYSKLTGSKLIIDWHNYGYSILGLSLKPNHLLVRISKWIEMYFGRMADAGFCVSEAMRQDLVENHGINYPLFVLYDRPPTYFRPLNLEEKHNFFIKLADEFHEFKSQDEDGTRFTTIDRSSKGVVLKSGRPAIIMSSTSWTEDEDFGLLFEALKQYDRSKTDELPNLVCVITGRGPMKSYYENKLTDFKHIQVILPWLNSEDYRKMVASCDLGVSLHSSSSKVDLPMKVVDMFGCGIPVLAYEYPAISELVVQDVYGLTFSSASDLCSKLVSVLQQKSVIDKYRRNIKQQFLRSRWEDNWIRKAKPLFDKLYMVASRKKKL